MRAKNKRTDQEIIDDFWARVNIAGPDECWEWQGCLRNGYGKMRVRGQWIGTHTFSLTLKLGALPPGALTCHHCDNPPCCNPAHLYAGSHQDNVDDCVRRKRNNAQKGEARYNAKLTNQDIMEIRATYSKYGKNGASGQALADKFGVGKMTISRIARGVNWKSVA